MDANDITALRTVLLRIGFDEADFGRHVRLGQDADMCFCVVESADGQWDVYYTERGSRAPHVRVSTILGAAYVLLGMIGRGDLLDAVRRTWGRTVPRTAYVIRQSRFSLRKPPDRAWCMRPRRGGWQVYQWVDGAERHRTEVSTEEGACDVLLGELGFGYLLPGLR